MPRTVWTEEQKKAFAEKMLTLRQARTPEPDSTGITVEPLVEAKKTITLHFTKSIEVFINGKAYVGKEIEAPSMQVAAEIVRIAKEAYGYSIL